MRTRGREEQKRGYFLHDGHKLPFCCGMWYDKWYMGKTMVKRGLISHDDFWWEGGKWAKTWGRQCSDIQGMLALIPQYLGRIGWLLTSLSSFIILALLPSQPSLSTAAHHILDLYLLPYFPTTGLISWKFSLASLVYRASPRTARATQKNLVSKVKIQTKERKGRKERIWNIKMQKPFTIAPRWSAALLPRLLSAALGQYKDCIAL